MNDVQNPNPSGVVPVPRSGQRQNTGPGVNFGPGLAGLRKQVRVERSLGPNVASGHTVAAAVAAIEVDAARAGGAGTESNRYFRRRGFQLRPLSAADFPQPVKL